MSLVTIASWLSLMWVWRSVGLIREELVPLYSGSIRKNWKSIPLRQQSAKDHYVSFIPDTLLRFSFLWKFIAKNSFSEGLIDFLFRIFHFCLLYFFLLGLICVCTFLLMWCWMFEHVIHWTFICHFTMWHGRSDFYRMPCMSLVWFGLV